MQNFRIPLFRKLLTGIFTTLCLVSSIAYALTATPVQAGGVTVNFTQVPQNMQLYQRNSSTNRATVIISGQVATSGQDEIRVTAYHQGTSTVEDNDSQNLTYSGGSASFTLSIDLVAELTQYQIEVVVRDGSTNETVLTVQNVLAGDVYIINGQSNAAAQRRNGSAFANSNQSDYIRSFGHREVNSENSSNGTTVTNSSWNKANGDTGEGAGAVGQWGLRMARRIVDTYNIPVALINGAVNGSEINSHLRNNGDPENINTIYGRLLWRTNRAEVTQTARALLWYQGEADSKTTHAAQYAGKFNTLYSSWQQDFVGLEQIYLLQIRNVMATCGDSKTQESIAMLREAQRQFADTYSNMQIMSTTGVDPQVGGCHFPYENGYEKIGENVFRLLARDFYGSGSTQNIDAPNIDYAYFSNGSSTEVTVVLRDADDTLTWNSGAEQDFRLEGSSPVVASGGSVSSNTIILTFPTSGSGITGLSYLGHTGQNPPGPNDAWEPADDPRVGQWVTNSNGVGLLAFYNVPISSGPPNGSPTVAITQPSNNSVVTQGSDVPITASASDSDGTITKVEFYADSTLLNTDTTAPYEYSWDNPAPGTYALKAVATDDDSASTESALVTLKVNQPPTVDVTSPAAETVVAAGAPITIQANPADTDGSISQVEFYAGAALLCTVNSAPWQCEWTSAPVGQHALTVKASDNDGASTTSGATSIRVNEAPAVTLTDPVNGSVFADGDNIEMLATASDNDGSVVQVAFYANDNLLCTDTAEPWQCELSNASTGSYVLKAVAADNNGASTESTQIGRAHV